MMTAERIADTVRRGHGRAAMAVGEWCDAYRPIGADEPMALRCRYMRLQALLMPAGGGTRAPSFGEMSWLGTFDTAYVEVGDYIRRPAARPGGGEDDIWFIASREALLPALCILTNRVVDILRPSQTRLLGAGTYGGAARRDAVMVARQWPVCLRSSSGRSTGGQEVPPGDRAEAWSVLMPPVPGVMPRRGDLVADDMGRVGTVREAVQSAMGWQLQVREAAT